MEKYQNWIVNPCENSYMLESILSFLLDYYSVLFGDGILRDEKCIVFNDPKADCPMLITNTPFPLIRLAQDSLTYWAQTIYQLSHEMCHYVFRQYKTQKDITLSWYEELVCESVSLLALEYSAQNWNECALSSNSPNFNKAIISYLQNELARAGTTEFSLSKTLKAMASYEKIAQENRASRINERNRLYKALSENPTDCRCIMDYQKYTKSNGVTLDLVKWYSDEQSSLIATLMEIIPIVL